MPGNSDDSDSDAVVFAKQGGIAFGGKFFSQLLGFVFLLIATRAVSPATYGIYTLALSVIVFAQVLSDLNLYRSLDYFLPQKLESEQFETARRILVDVSVLSFLSSVSFAVLLVLGSSVIAGIFDEPTLQAVLPILATALVLKAFVNIFTAVFRSLKALQYQVLVDNFVQPIVKVGAFAAFLFAGWELYGLIGAYLTALAAAFIAGAIVVSRISWVGVRETDDFSRWELLSYSLPLVFAGLFYKTVGQIDYFVIGWLMSPANVGTYRIGYQLTENIVIVLSSLIPIFKPMISENIDDQHALQRRFRLGVRWSTMFTIPVVLTLLVAPSEYLRVLFTAEYTDATLAVVVLSVGFLVNGSFGLTALLLEGTGRTRLNLLNGSLLLVVNVALDVLLVAAFGIVGAAIATTVARTLIIVLEMTEIRHLYGVTVNLTTIGELFAAAIPVLIVGKLLVWTIISPVVVVVMLPAVNILIYFSTLFALDAFDDADREVASLIDEKIGRPVLEPLVS